MTTSTATMLRIEVNGEPREVPDGASVAELMALLGLAAPRVAVELNLEIVPRSAWGATRLAAGDRLEVVHFIGGG
jgi:thiamine biosynthesis protein ThiS